MITGCLLDKLVFWFPPDVQKWTHYHKPFGDRARIYCSGITTSISNSCTYSWDQPLLLWWSIGHGWLNGSVTQTALMGVDEWCHFYCNFMWIRGQTCGVIYYLWLIKFSTLPDVGYKIYFTNLQVYLWETLEQIDT